MNFEAEKKDSIPMVIVRRVVFSGHESSETSSVIFESANVILKSTSLTWSNGTVSFNQMLTTNGHPIERGYFMSSKAAIN